MRAFIADVVRPRLPAGWFEQVRLDPDGNLVATRRGLGDARPLLLVTYAATFPAEGMAEAFVPRLVDGAAHGLPGPCLRGRGVTEQMAPLAAAVEARRALVEDPDLGRSTLTPTSVETWPRAMHTVPDLARMVFDRRLVPGEEIEAAMADIRAALASLEPFQVEARAGKFNYPNRVLREAEIAVLTRTALLAVAGRAPVTYWRATLDAGYFTRRGIPTILFGPGDIRLAHTDDEVVALQQVGEAAEVYRRVLGGG